MVIFSNTCYHLYAHGLALRNNEFLVVPFVPLKWFIKETLLLAQYPNDCSLDKKLFIAFSMPNSTIIINILSFAMIVFLFLKHNLFCIDV